jgi:hypothetical protein
MKKILALTAALGVTAALGAGVAEAKGQQEVTFEVTITNTSDLGQLETERAGGQIPLAPALWAVANGAGNPLFEVGEYASAGLELLAEDGSPAGLLDEANDVNRVSAAGAAFGPTGPILSDQSSTFEITASPGERLYLASMFVQSNDFFFANDNGIRLFQGNHPVSGDVTGYVDLWDAGTEVDETPGTGDFQPLSGSGVNTGDTEGGVIVLASDTGDGFDLPENANVIQVTIEPVG